MNSKVAIVLVNYNGWEDTIECLESLLRQNYPDFFITIVDNGSSDNSVKNIIEWAKGHFILPAPTTLQNFSYPPVDKPITLTFFQETEITKKSIILPARRNVVLIASEKNKGFAGGNNLATEFILQHSRMVSFIWYLNNDTVVRDSALFELVKCFREKERSGINLGILGSKLMFYHNPNLIQAIGATYNKWLGISHHVGCNEPDKGQYDRKPEDVHLDYIVGASMLVSRKFLEKVGLMDSAYFLYFEELDWIKRGQQLDFKYSYCPTSIVYHKAGKSTGGSHKMVKKSYIADFYSLSNRISFTKKYYPEYLLPVYFSLMGAIINRIKRGQFSRVKMILSILFNALFPSSRK